jgi:hypothetical protein
LLDQERTGAASARTDCRGNTGRAAADDNDIIVFRRSLIAVNFGNHRNWKYVRNSGIAQPDRFQIFLLHFMLRKKIFPAHGKSSGASDELRSLIT